MDLFGKLGERIIKSHKLIIIVWIVILLIAAPYVSRIGSVIDYEETSMAPPDIESEKAGDMISEQFGSSVDNSSIIVVLQGDVQSPSTRDYLLNLEDEIAGSNDVEYLNSVTTIYTVERDVFQQEISELAPAIYGTESGFNMTASLVFGIPETYTAVWENVNQTSSLLFSAPSLHIQYWLQSYGTDGNATYADTYAYQSTAATISYMNMTAEERAALMQYYNLFAGFWNASASNATMVANPQLRGEEAITGATNLYASGMDPQMAGGIMAVRSALNLTTWNNITALNGIAWAQSQQIISSMEVPSGNASGMDVDPSVIHGYFRAFSYGWNSSTEGKSVINPEAVEKEAMNHALTTILSSGPPSQFSMMVQAVSESLSLDTWNDSSAVREAAISFFSSTSGIGNITVLNEIYSLGPNAAAAEAKAMSESLVRNSTFASPPLPLPDEVVDGFVSGNVTIGIIGFSRGSDNPAVKENVRLIREIVHSAAPAGIRAYVSGDVAIGMDMQEESNKDIEKIDPITIILIFILIGAFFVSLVAPAVPVGSIGMAVVTAMAVIYLLSGITGNIHYSVLPMLTTAMFGAGSDYAIFIISRYREERLRGNSKEESIRTSVRWAGESITTSGITVMISFGSLTLTSFPMTQSMGVAISIGIGIALLVALTFIPSVLMLLGDRIFWPGHRRWDRKREKMGTGYFHKSAHFSLKHAKAIVIAALIISVPATYVIMEMETGFDFIAGMPQTESKDGMTVMSDGFGKGMVMPTYAVIRFHSPAYDNKTGNFSREAISVIENISAEFSSYEGVKSVLSPTQPQGTPISLENISTDSLDGGERLASALSFVGKDGRTVMIKIILSGDPLSRDSMSTIAEIRDFRDGFMRNNAGVLDNFLVGGSTAGMADISSIFDSDFHLMEVVVITGIFLVLLLVLGSVLVPLRLILTILLSVSWTLATTYIVFSQILKAEVLWMIPLILFVISMGLGMDYDVFLTTRIREEVLKGKNDEQAVVTAVEATGGIITACGLIMAGAFGTMLLSGMSMIQEFGFALAFLVLLDSLIVRIYVVPAMMILLGKWNWWAPGPLQRVNREKKD